MSNLDFLYRASNDDLLLLCDIVVKDKNGNYRMTEGLSSKQTFQRNYPNNIKEMLPELVDEVRRFGGNSFTNFFRGNGPEYSEILRDVARRNKVSFNKHNSDEQIE